MSAPPNAVVRFLRRLQAGEGDVDGATAPVKQWVRRRGLARCTVQGGPSPRWEITDTGIAFLKVAK